MFFASALSMSLFVSLLLPATAHSQSATVKNKSAAKDAPKRQARQYQPLGMDIEDIIRAEDDNDFLAYLAQREKAAREQNKYVDEHKAYRKRLETQQEKARLEFIATRDKRKTQIDLKAMKAHFEKQEAYEQEQEKARAQHIVKKRAEIEKIEKARQSRLEKLAKMGQPVPNMRMPASEDPPKYPAHSPLKSK